MLGTDDVARITGMTPRRILRWARMMGKRPGSGHPHEWSYGEVRQLAAAESLFVGDSPHTGNPPCSMTVYLLEAVPARLHDGGWLVVDPRGASRWTDELADVLPPVLHGVTRVCSILRLESTSG
jgi:hypothetical protein